VHKTASVVAVRACRWSWCAQLTLGEAVCRMRELRAEYNAQKVAAFAKQLRGSEMRSR
jgi:hypothetical protein